jgi:hypothetical protein
MLAPVLSVPLSRIVTHGDLYAVTFYPVANTRDVVAPGKVKLYQLTDDTLYVDEVGACFVGLTLDQRGA